MVILTSDKYFKARSKSHFVMINGPVNKEDIIIQNIYAPKNRASN